MSTGFSPATRRIICDRANNLCERCTRQGGEIHHRRPRGMGGSKDPLTNTPANGVLLCVTCHRWVESNRGRALLDGWLVGQGRNPSEIALRYRGSHWVRLMTDGSVRHDTTGAGAGPPSGTG